MDLRPYEEQTVRKRGASFFWWSVILLLLSGACFASWLGSFYVISHPEMPRCYRLLKKLKRLDPPKRFAVTDAPRGDFLTPARLLERYGTKSPAELERDNANLMRAYITNYRESKRTVVYVTGKYDVVKSVELGPKDFFPTGVAVVAQAIEHPQFVLEALFTARKATLPTITKAMPIGSDMALERSRDLFALLNVARLDDGRMQFTTVPLAYGGWRTKGGAVEFTLRSPEELEKEDRSFGIQIESGLPVVRGERLKQGLAAYADFRRKTLASTGDDQKALSARELERFEVKVTVPKDADPDFLPEPVPAVTPPPAPPASGTAAPAATPSPRGTLPRVPPTVAPAVPLPPRPVVRTPAGATPSAATPSAPSTAATAGGIPRVPGTRESEPLPAAPLPERRVMTTAQASALVEQFKPGERILLSGDFVVTGVLGQRVGLRTRESLRDAQADPKQPGSSAAFVVVDFPPGVKPPDRNAVLSRGGDNGFEIRDVIRDRNGQITIVATDRPR